MFQLSHDGGPVVNKKLDKKQLFTNVYSLPEPQNEVQIIFRLFININFDYGNNNDVEEEDENE